MKTASANPEQASSGSALSSPSIFVNGNCQLHAMAAVLDMVFPNRVRVVGVCYPFDPEFYGSKPRYIDEDQARREIRQDWEAGGRIAIVSQITPLNRYFFNPGLEAKDIALDITIPNLELYCLWPERRKISRSDPSTIKRLYDYDIGAIRSACARSTHCSDIADIVEQDLKSEPLFNTANHPTGRATARMTLEIVRALGGELALDSRPGLKGALEAHPGIDFDFAHPVPLDRLEALGWDWGPAYAAWSRGVAASAEARWADAVPDLELARAANPAQWKANYDLGTALVAAGQNERGIRCLETSRLLNLASELHQGRTLYQLLEAGMPPKAVLHRGLGAAERHPGYAPIHALIAKACIYAKEFNWGWAETHARKAMELEPENQHFAVLVAQVLQLQNRHAEGAAILKAYLGKHPGSAMAQTTLDWLRTIPA